MRFSRSRNRTPDEELEHAKAKFDEIVAHEIEQRAADLEQTLALARAESLTALLDEERRITEERRRDVAERERDASAKLAETLNGAQRRVDERLAGWGTDLEQLQESLAGELARIGQRLTLTQRMPRASWPRRPNASWSGRRASRADREAARTTSTALRRRWARAAHGPRAVRCRPATHCTKWPSDSAASASPVEQIERELGEAVERIGTQLGDVEHRQL